MNWSSVYNSSSRILAETFLIPTKVLVRRLLRFTITTSALLSDWTSEISYKFILNDLNFIIISTIHISFYLIIFSLLVPNTSSRLFLKVKSDLGILVLLPNALPCQLPSPTLSYNEYNQVQQAATLSKNHIALLLQISFHAHELNLFHGNHHS